MNKRILYGIKKKYFQYRDDYNCFLAESPKYIHLYANKKTAYQKLFDLEIQACRALKQEAQSFDYYLAGDDNDDELWQHKDEAMPAVKALYFKYFNQVIELTEDNWIDSIGETLAIPDDAKATQIDEIRKLLKISFYNIYEFEDKDIVSSYAIKFEANFFPKGDCLPSYQHKDWWNALDIEWLFYENAEAKDTAIRRLEYIFRSNYLLILNYEEEEEIPGFKGTYQDLSDTPEILKATLDSNNYFVYDDDSQRIALQYIREKPNKHFLKKEIEILFELLKSKPFEIIEQKIA